MTSRHYDAIVLGRSAGCLAAAALLARRDLSVLVLGQGERPPFYRWEGQLLSRRTFTLLSATSPCSRRLLQELAQTQRFRQRVRALDPMFTVMTPERRIEVPPDIELFNREIEREFPEVKQLVEELYANFAHVNAAADAAFERDAVWPPGTFWERFETNRVASDLPFSGDRGDRDLLGKFPLRHTYREIALVPSQFASHLAGFNGELPPFALARLHGAWTRGIQRLSAGEEEFARFLIERIEAHGGSCRLDSRATKVVLNRGEAAGVLIEGDEAPTGASFIVTDLSGEALGDLTGGQGITRKAQQDWPRMTVAGGRFVTSVVAKDAGLPELLPAESFILPGAAGHPDPRRPAIHLQRFSSADLGEVGPIAEDASLLVAEILLPARGVLTLLEGRDAILSVLLQQLPFLERHLLFVDSPHDGLPLHDYSRGERRDIDRVHLRDASPSAEPMEPLWSVEPRGYLDLGAEPVRGPIPRTFLVGKTVLPALGQEGELLAALSAARLITARDRARQKMRRQLWTKIET